MVLSPFAFKLQLHGFGISSLLDWTSSTLTLEVTGFLGYLQLL